MTALRATVVAVVAALSLARAGSAAAGMDQYPQGLLAGKTSGCSIETRPVAFAAYDVLSGTASSAQGQIIYTCSGGGKKKNVRLELSTGGAGTYQRRLSGNGERLFYNVFLDATRTTVWGDGSGGSNYLLASFPPAKTPISVPMYALIPPGQDVSAGQYTDVLQVRILF
jgi:spore coat protein U-like protein